MLNDLPKVAFINSGDGIYTNINQITTIEFSTKRDGKVVTFTTKHDGVSKTVYEDSDIYKYLVSLCID